MRVFSALILAVPILWSACAPPPASAAERDREPAPVSVLGAIGRGDGQCPLAVERREALLRAKEKQASQGDQAPAPTPARPVAPAAPEQ